MWNVLVTIKKNGPFIVIGIEKTCICKIPIIPIMPFQMFVQFCDIPFPFFPYVNIYFLCSSFCYLDLSLCFFNVLNSQIPKHSNQCSVPGVQTRNQQGVGYTVFTIRRRLFPFDYRNITLLSYFRKPQKRVKRNFLFALTFFGNHKRIKIRQIN